MNGFPSSCDALLETLRASSSRVIDTFRRWDDDMSGTIDKKEFRQAMPLLGLEVSKAATNELFDSWDPDGSGELTLKELNSHLRRDVVAEANKPVVVVEEEQEDIVDVDAMRKKALEGLG